MIKYITESNFLKWSDFLNINREQIKLSAKMSMAGSSPNPMIVTFIYWLISFILNYLQLSILIAGTNYTYIAENALAYGFDSVSLADYDNLFSGMLSSGKLLFVLVISVMASILSVGYTMYCLKVSRNEQAGIPTIFDGFTVFLRVIVLKILINIFVGLWSILLIIPGIIASYRYSMAVYLLIDNPDMSPMECIRASKEITRGRKGELFVLDLSFIGWFLLSRIAILGTVIGMWTNPYMGITYSNFYNKLITQANSPNTGYYDNSNNTFN